MYETIQDFIKDKGSVPINDWPSDIFDKIGIMNPNTTGNLRCWLKGIEQSASMKGSVVECGTFKGESIAPIAYFMQQNNDNRLVYGFDSFEGFPDLSDKDLVDGSFQGRGGDYFAQTSFDLVNNLINQMNLSDKVKLVKGFFEETLPKFDTGPISVLILDCDLYDSYKTCLEYLYPKVEKGGWIYFDEYYSARYPGGKKAVDEFFADKPEKLEYITDDGTPEGYQRWFVRKI